MKQPETIREMLDCMQMYVDEATVIDASDVSHDLKIEKLTALSKVYHLYG